MCTGASGFARRAAAVIFIAGVRVAGADGEDLATGGAGLVLCGWEFGGGAVDCGVGDGEEEERG
jgi:hypothetical protein